jgi:hypothetical protein
MFGAKSRTAASRSPILYRPHRPRRIIGGSAAGGDPGDGTASAAATAASAGVAIVSATCAIGELNDIRRLAVISYQILGDGLTRGWSTEADLPARDADFVDASAGAV